MHERICVSYGPSFLGKHYSTQCSRNMVVTQYRYVYVIILFLGRRRQYRTAAEKQKAYRLRKGQRVRTILKGIIVSKCRYDSLSGWCGWNVRLPNGSYIDFGTFSGEDQQIIESFLKASKIPREPFLKRWRKK
jgi:hypothetical protein